MNTKKEGKPEEQKTVGSHVTFMATPEKLISQASQLSAAIADAEASIQEIEELLGKTNLYWLGDAAVAHRNAYRGKKLIAEQVISSLYQQIENLLQMAGIYKEAEREADNEAQALPEDVLQ